MIRLLVMGSSLGLLFSCSSPAPTPRAKTAAIAAQKPSSPAPNPDSDPCANRLHDICGRMLLYYAEHRELPQNLDQFKGVPGFDVGDLACPVSKQPYVYVRNPLPVAGVQGGVVIYDATPVHAGYRWGVTVLPPQGGGPLVLKVVALPRGWNPLVVK
ncbi:MAG TPA: hypothetical protein VF669_00670 [Tepidisphaeraceae bacterium]|jgi:hypothetical protein